MTSRKSKTRKTEEIDEVTTDQDDREESGSSIWDMDIPELDWGF